MINLPFNKWKLNFIAEEFEVAYEEHLNKIRLLSFQIINLFIFVAALIGLITFVIQQQPLIVLIFMGLTVIGCLSFQVMSKKFEPHLKQVFSFYYAFSLMGHVFIAWSGFQIPSFVFGYNFCCQAVVMMQYSDNRLKVLYTIITPIILLVVFDVFQIVTLHFVFQTSTCALLIGVCTYMNEYTSRLAFSLNLIANKQKDLMNELINDGIVAISLKEISRQFQAEFHNTQFQNILKSQFGQNFVSSKNIELESNIKQFLRSSYIINSINKSQTKLIDKNSHKFTKLEDYCFALIKDNNAFNKCENIQEKIEIGYQVKEEMRILHLLVKKVNFGKPLLILIVKSIETPQQIQQYEQVINDYQKLIYFNSEKHINKLIQFHQELKNSRLQQNKVLIKFQCLNLQMINYLRNYVMYFNKIQIFQENNLQFETIQLINFVNKIGQYFQGITDFYQIKFQIFSLFQSNLITRINPKLLSQISMNIFEEIISYHQDINMILFEVGTDICNCNLINDSPNIQESKLVETQIAQKQLMDQKVISFTFIFDSTKQIDFINLYPQEINVLKNQNNFITLTDNIILSCVNKLLLNKLGPYDNIKINSKYLIEKEIYQYTFSYLIYNDQSLIEPSYYKVLAD